jgi:hypothetical protein
MRLDILSALLRTSDVRFISLPYSLSLLEPFIGRSKILHPEFSILRRSMKRVSARLSVNSVDILGLVER